MSEVRLIDANALKEEFNRPFWEKWEWDIICKAIDNAPTVEYPFYQEAYQTGYEEGKNERPKGEWKEYQIKGKDFFGKGFICKCSRIVMQKENFCPNCGADMGGGAE